DLKLLAEIERQVRLPLVVHGGTGFPHTQEPIAIGPSADRCRTGALVLALPSTDAMTGRIQDSLPLAILGTTNQISVFDHATGQRQVDGIKVQHAQ
ncbi:MAG: hypothetical protein ACLQGP_29060, partial [Isosphaeraceae bacterium]